MKTRHGHYSDIFENEAQRIKKLYKDVLDIDITWTEATAIAAERSGSIQWDTRKLRDILSKLRGIL